MRAKEFTIEAKLGTEPKRPARPGSRPDRGHNAEPRYTEEPVGEDSDPCWKDYKQIGMKKKDGKSVPNCVPKESAVDEAYEEDPDEYHVLRHQTKDDIDREITMPKAWTKVKQFDTYREAKQAYDAMKAKYPNDKFTVTTHSHSKMAAWKKERGIAEQFCEECGGTIWGSIKEHGKASRELCKSSKPDADLGASMLASCKSQGLRARDGNKSHKLGKSPKSRVKVGGHRIKGQKYGGPLPDWS